MRQMTMNEQLISNGLSCLYRSVKGIWHSWAQTLDELIK